MRSRALQLGAPSRCCRLDTWHLAVQSAHRCVKCQRLARLEVAPDFEVVLHGLHGGDYDGASALAVAAGTPQQALEVGGVLCRDTVVEGADVRVIERLGGVKHILQDDKGVTLRRSLEYVIDIQHIGRDG